MQSYKVYNTISDSSTREDQSTPLSQWNTIILSAFNTLELLTLSRNNLLLPFFKIGKEKIALTLWFKKWQKTFYSLFSKQSWKMWQTITQLNLECCIYSHWCHADLASLSCKVKLRVQSIKRVKRRRRVLLALCYPPGFCIPTPSEKLSTGQATRSSKPSLIHPQYLNTVGYWVSNIICFVYCHQK